MTDGINSGDFVAMTKALTEALAVARSRRPPLDDAMVTSAVTSLEECATMMADAVTAVNYGEMAVVVKALLTALLSPPGSWLREHANALFSTALLFSEGELVECPKNWTALHEEACDFRNRYDVDLSDALDA